MPKSKISHSIVPHGQMDYASVAMTAQSHEDSERAFDALGVYDFQPLNLQTTLKKYHYLNRTRLVRAAVLKFAPAFRDDPELARIKVAKHANAEYMTVKSSLRAFRCSLHGLLVESTGVIDQFDQSPGAATNIADDPTWQYGRQVYMIIATACGKDERTASCHWYQLSRRVHANADLCCKYDAPEFLRHVTVTLGWWSNHIKHGSLPDTANGRVGGLPDDANGSANVAGVISELSDN